MRALLLVWCLSLVLPFAASAQVTEVDADTLYAGGPAAPVITSSTHPDPEKWYSAGEATFSWELGANVSAVAIGVASTSGQEPMKSYRPPVSEITFKPGELNEGINYLSVQLRNFEKWGMYTERLIKIDNTAPTPFVISLNQVPEDDDTLRLSFETSDTLSGIDHYEVLLGNRSPERLSAAEAKVGVTISAPVGQSQIKVIAYDQAGNTRESSVVMVPTKARTVSSPIGIVAEEPASFLVAMMAAIMLLMFGYLIYERQRYARSIKKLRQETGEVHDQLVRIFTALREEIYDQIRGITKKSRMTKGEQSAVDGLNKALSVSESLIAKEVKDVKKLLEG